MHHRIAFGACIGLIIMLVGAGFAKQAADEQAPKPFLAEPFDHALAASGQLSISQGWIYSPDEKEIHQNIPTHFANDIPLPWGTPIYCPADGLAVASYHTYDITNDKTGQKIGFGLGLFVQIWHEKAAIYTLYAHLSNKGATIPYIEPTLENGSWQPRAAIYLPVNEFKKKAVALKRGAILGYVGHTGLRNGYTETPACPATVDPKTQKTWDPHGDHLHWEVYRRVPDGTVKDPNARFDPHGLNAEREKYTDVFKRASGLILANPDGSPQFAH